MGQWQHKMDFARWDISKQNYRGQIEFLGERVS
jgi:hypothetical protein